MNTIDFVQDQKAVEDWLEATVNPLRQRGIYVSHWSHDDGQSGRRGKQIPGFGLVIVDEGSGEFHLMPDGSVTRHAEDAAMAVVLDEHHPPTDLETVVALFEEFKNRIVFRAHGA